MSGQTSQDQATCLKEARNALNGDNKMACQDRIRGDGKVTGSVSGGGLLREIETVIPTGRVQ